MVSLDEVREEDRLRIKGFEPERLKDCPLEMANFALLKGEEVIVDEVDKKNQVIWVKLASGGLFRTPGNEPPLSTERLWFDPWDLEKI